jgi:putative flavoprotein involved in K+ transport
MGKTASSRIGLRMQARETLIGSSPRAARRRHGIHLHGRAVGVSGTAVSFDDGARLEARAVVWATGFRRDDSWIDEPVFDAGDRLVHERGVTASPGLYFLGLPWQHTRGSALLGWVKDDAEYLARRIDSAPATVAPMARSLSSKGAA